MDVVTKLANSYTWESASEALPSFPNISTPFLNYFMCFLRVYLFQLKNMFHTYLY